MILSRLFSSALWMGQQQQEITRDEDRELNTRGQIDLVDLIPFDVQFALTVEINISIFDVTDIVTEWLNSSFREGLNRLYPYPEEFAKFDRVILHDRSNRRELALAGDHQTRGLQQSSPSSTAADATLGFLYTARLAGHVLLTRMDQQVQSVPQGDILELQRRTLQSPIALVQLRQALQDADPRGFGTALVDVNAYLNPIVSPTAPQQPQPVNTNNNHEELQLVIIVAVVVACVAFLFLIVAVLWAWRYDRINRMAYLNNNNTPKQVDRTGSDTTEAVTPEKTLPPPPLAAIYPDRLHRVDGDGLYPESVITEDISTALSQYYRSGLAGTNNPYVKHSSSSYMGGGGYINDAASVSSMESYGYSLDGYAPTIATPMPSDYLEPRINLTNTLQQQQLQSDEDESNL